MFENRVNKIYLQKEKVVNIMFDRLSFSYNKTITGIISEASRYYFQGYIGEIRVAQRDLIPESIEPGNYIVWSKYSISDLEKSILDRNKLYFDNEELPKKFGLSLEDKIKKIISRNIASYSVDLEHNEEKIRLLGINRNKTKAALNAINIFVISEPLQGYLGIKGAILNEKVKYLIFSIAFLQKEKNEKIELIKENFLKTVLYKSVANLYNVEECNNRSCVVSLEDKYSVYKEYAKEKVGAMEGYLCQSCVNKIKENGKEYFKVK